MNNLIQSKEEQIRKQEADIAKKTVMKKLHLSSPCRRHPWILQATAYTKCHLRASHTRANSVRE